MRAPCLAAVKGSPDGLLPLCSRVILDGAPVPFTDALRDRFRRAHADMARDGLRVLAMAFRTLPDGAAADAPAPAALERDLTLCGLAGLIDPPRPEVAPALAAAHRAGIRTVMITGDHPLTAEAIARDLDLPGDGRPPVVATGADIAALSPDALADAASRTDVYARTTPEDKLRIVTALQARGEIVAMTGDGVNDAPALKKADIGVAMGRTGTDVAREASKMALLDDNYATLVAAVEEGRTIYDDLIRFLRYSFGGNLAKTLAMLLAPALGLGAIALLPLHLLWLNLLTDGLLGLGIGLEAAEADAMRRPPRSPFAPVFDRSTLLHVAWVGLLIGAGSLALAFWARTLPGAPWQTVLFAAIGFGQIGQAWGLRAWSGRPFRFAPNPTLLVMTFLALLLQLAVLYLPPAARTFSLVPLAPVPLLATAGFGILVFLALHLPLAFRPSR
jgi:Ca2+-transporting ATPase